MPPFMRLGLLLQTHTQSVFCICIPCLLKFQKIEIEIDEPHFPK
jgi:hypothetical protein